MPESTTSRRHPHRWLQFRLRSLLAVMLLAAIGAGVTARYLALRDLERRQAQAIALLSGRLGSRVRLNATELKLPGPFQEDELLHVAYLKRLNRLSISGSNLSKKGLGYLELLPELRELELQNCQLTDDGVLQLARLKRLDKLNLLGTRVNKTGLECICRMTRLKRLVVHLPQRAKTDQLRQLVQLESLRLAAGNTLGGDDLEFLADLPQLRTFWLQCSVEGDVLKSLRHVPHLTELRLQANQLTDKDLDYIRGHTSLRHLTLESNSGNYVSDIGLYCLVGMTDLRFLNLSNCRGITDRGLARLTQLQKLRTLRLRWTLITDEGMTHLAELHRLENLNLDGTDVTIAGLNRLGFLHRLSTLGMPGGVSNEDWTETRQQYPNMRLQ